VLLLLATVLALPPREGSGDIAAAVAGTAGVTSVAAAAAAEVVDAAEGPLAAAENERDADRLWTIVLPLAAAPAAAGAGTARMPAPAPVPAAAVAARAPGLVGGLAFALLIAEGGLALLAARYPSAYAYCG